MATVMIGSWLLRCGFTSGAEEWNLTRDQAEGLVVTAIAGDFFG